MKKFLIIALSFALLLSTTACGLNPEAEALKKENEQLKEQLGVTEEKATKKPIEKSADTKSSDKNSDSQYELITGTYVVPDDIPVGKYDVKVISGNGYFLVDGFDSDMSVFDEMDVNADENSNSISERRNLTLNDGCTIQIHNNLKVQLIPKD